MRPESILSEMLDRISTLEGVDPVEQRLLYERAQEAMRYAGEIRAERDALRAQVARFREAGIGVLHDSPTGTDVMILAAVRPSKKAAAEFADKTRAIAVNIDESRDKLRAALAATEPGEESDRA